MYPNVGEPRDNTPIRVTSRFRTIQQAGRTMPNFSLELRAGRAWRSNAETNKQQTHNKQIFRLIQTSKQSAWQFGKECAIIRHDWHLSFSWNRSVEQDTEYVYIYIYIYIYTYNMQSQSHSHVSICIKVVSDSYHFISPQNSKFLRSRQDLGTLAPARALAMLAMTSGNWKQKRKHWKLYTRFFPLQIQLWTKLGLMSFWNMLEAFHCCSDQMLKTSIF